ncbi:TPA: phosphohydrolase [Candidatus Sumerlaeota bacterium]|jgi:poly(A) polymerase|nr:phosphohydrolase [Candidatus Sumerlaeota bacterium]
MITWQEDSPIVKAARRVAQTLRAAGFQAYWVGGCVRDARLGRDPKDIDVATNATPEQALALFPRALAIGAQFGVICVIDHGVQTEIATFRNDGAYVDGRRPTSVCFSTPEEDAARRDFTINALFYDPENGEIRDFTGGQADMQARILRAIGKPAQRFEEDALRLLRAVRFAMRFDLTIEAETFAAIQEKAPGIHRVSAERIRDELVRIFTGPRPGAALQLISETKLLSEVLPEVEVMHGVEQPPQYHPEGDVFTHTVLSLDHLPPDPSPTLAIATLLHDVGKPPTFVMADRIRFNQHASVGADMVDGICRRLKFSNDERERIVALVRDHMQFLHVQEMRPSNLRRFIGQEHFDEHLALHRCDCLSSHRNLDNYVFCQERLREYAEASTEPVLPPPFLNGDALIRTGYKPGPHMGEILRAAHEAQLDGELHTAEEALEWVKTRYPQ